MREITDYVSSFEKALKASEIPDIQFVEASGQEVNARNKLFSLADAIGSKTEPIIDAMLNVLEQNFITSPPTFDVNSIVTLITTAITKELDENNPNSIYAFRVLLKNHINTILLDNAFSILTTDETDITTTVNSFITRSKATLEEEMFLFERQKINELATKGTLDSFIATEAIARIEARKGRRFKEIENEAEELRMKLRTEAFERAFERQRVRLQGFQLLPVSFPQGLFPVLGELIDKRFLNPQQFLANLPNVLDTSMQGFRDLAGLIQTSRLAIPDTNTKAVQSYSELLNVVAQNLSNVALAVAKFGTMEAS